MSVICARCSSVLRSSVISVAQPSMFSTAASCPLLVLASSAERNSEKYLHPFDSAQGKTFGRHDKKRVHERSSDEDAQYPSSARVALKFCVPQSLAWRNFPSSRDSTAVICPLFV